jgi:ADP-heptose:LPS heptosyltransferase
MCAATSHFYERTKSARKIIVVDLGFLGDSVHLIPALYEIKRHYPEAALHTLSATVGAEVLKLAPCVDLAWAFPLTPESPPWWKHWDIIEALRREKFDVAFNFSGADRTIFFTALTGAKWRLAHEGGRKHFWNRWLIRNWVPRQSREIPVYEQRRQVLKAAGFSLESARFDLPLPELPREFAAKKIPENSIHLSINASGVMKEWPLQNWIDLATRLLRHGPSTTLVATAAGKAREVERLRRLVEAAPDSRLIALENLNIGQLAAVLERCRLHIGGDSGVLHLATALGVPTLTIGRHYDEMREWIPTGAKHRFLTADCQCIKQANNACIANGKSACLESISAEQVMEATRAMRPIAAKNLKL